MVWNLTLSTSGLLYIVLLNLASMKGNIKRKTTFIHQKQKPFIAEIDIFLEGKFNDWWVLLTCSKGSFVF